MTIGTALDIRGVDNQSGELIMHIILLSDISWEYHTGTSIIICSWQVMSGMPRNIPENRLMAL
jgi:hypothetical protein